MNNQNTKWLQFEIRFGIFDQNLTLMFETFNVLYANWNIIKQNDNWLYLDRRNIES